MGADVIFGWLGHFAGGYDIPLITPALWDSAPLGRVGKIVQASPRKDRYKLRQFFQQFDPVAVLLLELKLRDGRSEFDPAPAKNWTGDRTGCPCRDRDIPGMHTPHAHAHG